MDNRQREGSASACVAALQSAIFTAIATTQAAAKNQRYARNQ
jgi:hypothetical protein